MTTTLKKPAPKKPSEWHQVGQRFEALGADLRKHFARIGQDAAEQRTALEKAVEALVKDIEKMFLAAGDTLRDPVLRKDIAKIGEAVRNAMQDTARAADTTHAGRTHGHTAHTATKPAPAKRPARKPTTRTPAKAKRTS